mgnify:CR=1 FL=1
MENTYSCDIVYNNNPKSKRFGQYGIALTNDHNCSYINYQDGETIYCNIRKFSLVKRFYGGEKIGNDTVRTRTYWGCLQITDVDGVIRRLSRDEMWRLAQKYIRRAAVVV